LRQGKISVVTGASAGLGTKLEFQDWILANPLIPRHGQPDDFDGALLPLASHADRYITGRWLIVDSGGTAH
jgi:NAD(P)-dependent dehydrogenase (short-subunit alcohol dehydrogenase family)